jgi:hypothetical protein
MRTRSALKPPHRLVLVGLRPQAARVLDLLGMRSQFESEQSAGRADAYLVAR